MLVWINDYGLSATWIQVYANQQQRESNVYRYLSGLVPQRWRFSHRQSSGEPPTRHKGAHFYSAFPWAADPEAAGLSFVIE